MTTHTGDEGLVKIGANTVAEVRSFSFSESAVAIEDTAKGDASVTRRPGRLDASGSLSCWWDQDDTNGQVILIAGAAVDLILQVEGDASGDFQYTVPAIITEVEHSSPEGDVIAEANFSFVASGAVTRAAVV